MEVKDEAGSPGFEDDVSLSPASPVKTEQIEDDDDKYEDALDLDTSQSKAKVWMVRMPKFLLDKWRDLDRFGGEELGKVRIWPQQGSQPWKVRLVVNDTPETKELPHNYDLKLVHQTVDNTYVLKEEELPRKRTRTNADPLESREGPRTTYGPAPENTQAAYDRYAPTVKNTPKKTALVGQVVHECVVTPDFKDPNYTYVVQRRREMEQAAPERQVTLLNDTSGVGGMKYGATLRSQRASWLKVQNRKDIYKNGDGKAIRIDKNELLDKLFRLFEEYEYWTLKGLKDRTKQPEVYLKEVLETVAILNKKGPYAMKYGLRSEFKQMKHAGVPLANMVSDAQGSSEFQTLPKEEEEEDEDEDDQMETVL